MHNFFNLYLEIFYILKNMLKISKGLIFFVSCIDVLNLIIYSLDFLFFSWFFIKKIIIFNFIIQSKFIVHCSFYSSLYSFDFFFFC